MLLRKKKWLQSILAVRLVLNSINHFVTNISSKFLISTFTHSKLWAEGNTKNGIGFNFEHCLVLKIVNSYISNIVNGNSFYINIMHYTMYLDVLILNPFMLFFILMLLIAMKNRNMVTLISIYPFKCIQINIFL